MKNSIDSGMRSTRDQSYELFFNDTVVSLVKDTEESHFKTKTTYRLCSRINDYLVGKELIDQLFWFYPEGGFVICRSGVYHPSAYYSLYNSKNAKDYSAWLAAMEQKGDGYFMLETSDGPQLYYRSAFPMNAKEEAHCAIVTRMSNDGVSKLLHRVNALDKHLLVAILDQDGTPYQTLGDRAYLNRIDWEKATQPNGYYSNDLCVIVKDSEVVPGFRYLLVKEAADVLMVQKTLTSLVLIFLLVGVITAVALALYASWHTSRPIVALAKKLSSEGECLKNEHDLILEKVDAMAARNMEAIEQMKAQKRLIRTSLARTLLSAECPSVTTVEQIVLGHGLTFENNGFCTAIVYCTQFEQDEVPRWCDDILTEMLHTVSESELTAIYTVYRQSLVCLFNYASVSNDELFYVRRFLCEFQKKCLPQTEVAICVGPFFQNPIGFLSSYSDAVRNGRPQAGELVFTRKNVAVMVEEFDLLTPFTQAVQHHEYKQAQQLLLENGSLYLEKGAFLQQQCHRYALCNVLLSAVQQTFTGGKEKSALSELLSRRVPQKQQIQNFCDVLEALSVKNPAQQGNHTARGAKEIIDRDYANPILGLYSISEALKVSNSYVSRVFKETYGYGVSEYINFVRIERAKELILKENLSIKAIALHVGFSSDISFIRVFKRYEKTTPGKFCP
ncbi:MAG: AraC family transcriptional regulator [Ruthenibacterium sp.]